MFGWFKSNPGKVVKVYTTTVTWTDAKCKETITLILYENEKGKRTFKILDSGYCKIYNMWKDCDLRLISELWKAGSSLGDIKRIVGG